MQMQGLWESTAQQGDSILDDLATVRIEGRLTNHAGYLFQRSAADHQLAIFDRKLRAVMGVRRNDGSRRLCCGSGIECG